MLTDCGWDKQKAILRMAIIDYFLWLFELYHKTLSFQILFIIHQRKRLHYSLFIRKSVLL